MELQEIADLFGWAEYLAVVCGVAVLSSGANCFTKTTGVITGFISGGAI
jgi:hypothetical protein